MVEDRISLPGTVVQNTMRAKLNHRRLKVEIKLDDLYSGIRIMRLRKSRELLRDLLLAEYEPMSCIRELYKRVV